MAEAEVSKATRQTIARHAQALWAAQTALDDAINKASLVHAIGMLFIPLDVRDLGQAQDEVARQHQNPPAVAAARKALNDLLASIGVSPEAWAQVYADALQRAKQDRSGS